MLITTVNFAKCVVADAQPECVVHPLWITLASPPPTTSLSNCRPHHSYTARLNRLKREAGETLALFGDEFEEQLSPEDFGFVEPSSFSDSGVGSENNDPRSADSGGGGRLDVMEDANEGGGDDAAAVPVMERDDVLLLGGGGEGVKAAAAAAAVTSAGVPVPSPMKVEESEWDGQGDCVPLPAWKVCTCGARKVVGLRSESVPRR